MPSECISIVYPGVYSNDKVSLTPFETQVAQHSVLHLNMSTSRISSTNTILALVIRRRRDSFCVLGVDVFDVSNPLDVVIAVRHMVQNQCAKRESNHGQEPRDENFTKIWGLQTHVST